MNTPSNNNFPSQEKKSQKEGRDQSLPFLIQEFSKEMDLLLNNLKGEIFSNE